LAWLALAAPAAAEPSTAPKTAALPPPDLHLDTASALPHPLHAADADRYRAIFRLQEGGDWPGADRLIGQLGNRLLLGHVLAQRYLHPTAYRSAYPELREWLERYADLPEAQQIYRLAGVRKQKGDAPAREPTAVLRRLGTPDSGGEPTDPNWQTGLAAWRFQSMTEAARQFEMVANDKTASDWARAAGAFWAARSHLKNREPAKVSKWMRVAASYPRTFYGQLARSAWIPGLPGRSRGSTAAPCRRWRKPTAAGAPSPSCRSGGVTLPRTSCICCSRATTAPSWRRP
jgi:hypothetical protein